LSRFNSNNNSIEKLDKQSFLYVGVVCGLVATLFSTVRIYAVAVDGFDGMESVLS
jgi:hypothetical protein